MLLFYLSAMETEEESKKMWDAYENDKDFLYHIAVKYTRDHQRAEDAVHNCYLSIIRHKEKCLNLPSGNLRALCVTIVKHCCIDILRRQSHYVETPVEDFYRYYGDEEPVDEQVILMSEYDTLKKQLKSLDQESQSILEMRYKCGLSYKEIADILDVTTKHIDFKLTQSKVKLKKLLISEV